MSNIQDFWSYKNIFKTIDKNKLVSCIIEEYKLNMKTTWSVLKEIIGKKNDNTNFPLKFVINDEAVCYKTIIAESFNDYFSKIGL